MFLSPTFLLANVKGKVFGENNEPLIGASVYSYESNVSQLTLADGSFELNLPAGNRSLVISYLGYQTDTITISHQSENLINLRPNTVLEEVVIKGSQTGLVNFRATPIQTQEITFAELCRAACCNLSESFETNPSVDVSYTDAATGAKQIRLLGLSGIYVQMINENIPTYRGLGGVYGLSYVPGMWMDGIQLSKGTSSVANGYEAITGQINVEYKKPHLSDPFSINIFGSSEGRFELNSDAAVFVNPKLSTMLLLHASKDTHHVDKNNDGFLDAPQTEQYSIFNRWNYANGNYTSQFGVRGLYENRKGGQVNHHGYKIGINTMRADAFLKNGIELNKEKESSIGIIANAVFHRQESNYGLTEYDATQTSYYLNALYQTHLTNDETHFVKTGIGIQGDIYQEKLNMNDMNDTYIVPGMFVEYTYKIAQKFVLLAGLRADYSNHFNMFYTPRLHIKYMPKDDITIRFSAGKGYRTPLVLIENNNLLASNRTFELPASLQQEVAWNTGLNTIIDIPIGFKKITLSAEYYYTLFENQLVIDLDTYKDRVLFVYEKNSSFAHNAQLELSSEPIDGLTLLAAYRYNDAKSVTAGQLQDKSLMSKHKGLITASYKFDLNRWQIDLTSQLNGGGRMPNPDAINPLWNNTFDPYQVYNAQLSRYFKNASIYVGVENITNFTQSNAIISANNPFSSDFDATMIWGPLHGRKLYAGLRYSIPKK